MTESSPEVPPVSAPAESETLADEANRTEPEITTVPEADATTPPEPVTETDEEPVEHKPVVGPTPAVPDVTETVPTVAAETTSMPTDPTEAETHSDEADPSEPEFVETPDGETAPTSVLVVDRLPADRSEDSPSAVDTDTSQPARTPTDVMPITSETAEKLTLDTVDSFSDFLRYIEELDGDLKPFEMRRSSPVRIAVAKPTDLKPLQDRIAAVAVRDTKLATALALLLTTEKSDLSGTARRNVTDLAARILTQHPAFAGDEPFQDRVARLRTETADTETLSQTVVRLENLVGRPFAGSEPLKAPVLHALKDNAIHAVVLIAGSAAQWTLPQYIDALADELWDVESVQPGTTADREKLASIPKSTRRTAAVIAGSSRDRIRAVESERDSANARVDIAYAEKARISEELAAARGRVEELDKELADVRAALDIEAGARRSERMSSTNSFEILRVDTARLIADQIEVLEDALDALKHGHTQVTDEFVSRSVIKFRKGLTALQPDAAQDK